MTELNIYIRKKLVHKLTFRPIRFRTRSFEIKQFGQLLRIMKCQLDSLFEITASHVGQQIISGVSDSYQAGTWPIYIWWITHNVPSKRSISQVTAMLGIGPSYFA